MANWMTQQVEGAESIEVDRGSLIEVRKEGLIIKKSDMIRNQAPASAASTAKELVFPINEMKTWKENFYELVWSENLQDKLLLLLQVLVKDQEGKLVQIGYAVKELTQEDSKLVFGTFELGLVKPPISLRPTE